MEETTKAAWDHIMAHTELLGRNKFGFFAAMDRARQSSEDIDPEEIISELASLVVDRFLRENNMDKSATKLAIAAAYTAEMGEEQ
ncbi:hypothetical protein AYJ66_07280 [Dietzia cinnamea]|nr:hypothetical protein AYJ66_07280 [Dietzia cinnamea]